MNLLNRGEEKDKPPLPPPSQQARLLFHSIPFYAIVSVTVSDCPSLILLPTMFYVPD